MEELDDEVLKYSLDEAIEDMISILEWMYVDHMMCTRTGKYRDFLRDQVQLTKDLCSDIHNRLCDHVESAKNEKLARMGLK